MSTEKQFQLMLSTNLAPQDMLEQLQQLDNLINDAQNFHDKLLKVPESQRTPLQIKFLASKKTEIAVFSNVRNILQSVIDFHFGTGYQDMANVIELQKKTIAAQSEHIADLRKNGDAEANKNIRQYIDNGNLWRNSMSEIIKQELSLKNPSITFLQKYIC